jgi:transposase
MITDTSKKDSLGRQVRMKLPNISMEEKSQILALSLAGVKNPDISAQLGMSLRSVQRILKGWKQKKTLDAAPKKGRNRKVSPEIEKRIVELIESDRRMAPGAIVETLAIEFPGFQCCTRTIQSYLIRHGFHGRVCVKKPLLRPANKIRRLEWARAHKNWTVEQWKQVLWSDEKKFELFNSKRRQYCRRKEGEDLRDDTIQPTVKHGGGSLMFWGCFGNSQVGHLFKINGIMDQHKYHQILVHHAFPSAATIFGNTKFQFMQDNDPKHTSAKVKNYLASKVNAPGSNVEIMDWPSQSPDLSPLELLWEECDRQVKRMKPSNLEMLEAAVRQVWNNMPADKMDKLINRMPSLCKAVIDAEGGYFIEKNASKRKAAKQTVY